MVYVQKTYGVNKKCSWKPSVNHKTGQNWVLWGRARQAMSICNHAVVCMLISYVRCMFWTWISFVLVWRNILKFFGKSGQFLVSIFRWTLFCSSCHLIDMILRNMCISKWYSKLWNKWKVILKFKKKSNFSVKILLQCFKASSVGLRGFPNCNSEFDLKSFLSVRRKHVGAYFSGFLSNKCVKSNKCFYHTFITFHH